MRQEPVCVTSDRLLITETFKDLVFIEEGHKYFLHGKELPSVSAVTHRYKPEFDADKVAIGYAKKNGQTPEYWKDQWKFKNLKATTTGTRVHEFGEGLFWLRMGRPDLIPDSAKGSYIPDKGWLIPTRPKEEAVLKFYNELPDTDFPVLAETKVYNNFNPSAPPMITSYCGTFDILFYREIPGRDDLSGYIIRDFKTNRELYSDYAKTRKKVCLPPFSDLPDEAFSMYTLQLGCYQIPLEDLGLKIIGREIIWLRDSGDYELIQVPNITTRLRNIL